MCEENNMKAVNRHVCKCISEFARESVAIKYFKKALKAHWHCDA